MRYDSGLIGERILQLFGVDGDVVAAGLFVEVAWAVAICR
jgi:hypothetical protein